jgi:hypothetical protein
MPKSKRAGAFARRTEPPNNLEDTIPHWVDRMRPQEPAGSSRAESIEMELTPPPNETRAAAPPLHCLGTVARAPGSRARDSNSASDPRRLEAAPAAPVVSATTRWFADRALRCPSLGQQEAFGFPTPHGTPARLVAAVIRVAQGSATVALLTTAAMIEPMLADAALPYHPVYSFAAIGFGGMIFQ